MSKSKVLEPEPEVLEDEVLEVIDLTGLKVKRPSTLPFKRLFLLALVLTVLPSAAVIMFHNHPVVSPVTDPSGSTTTTTIPTKPTSTNVANTALCLFSQTISTQELNVTVSAPYSSISMLTGSDGCVRFQGIGDYLATIWYSWPSRGLEHTNIAITGGTTTNLNLDKING